MQDRYVGDVGDFGKFALLRALCGGTDQSLRLAVVWCTYPDKSHNGDGRHLAYLERPEFAVLNSNLHEILRGLVKGGRRSLVAVEEAGVLPPETSFFLDTTVRNEVRSGSGARRVAYRRIWRERALLATRSADMVFFDPDNGIEAASIPAGHPRAGKYVFWDDLLPFWKSGPVTNCLSSPSRTASAARQTETLRTQFFERLGPIAFLTPLLFRRGSCRHLWIVGQAQHSLRLDQLSSQFLANGWDRHFDSKWPPIFKPQRPKRCSSNSDSR